MHLSRLSRNVFLIGGGSAFHRRRSQKRRASSQRTAPRSFCRIGHACAAYQDRVMRGLNCKRLQLDEQWGFVGMKSKNVPKAKKEVFGYGDVYVWLALDADTKLIPCWHVGPRNASAIRR